MGGITGVDDSEDSEIGGSQRLSISLRAEGDTAGRRTGGQCQIEHCGLYVAKAGYLCAKWLLLL